MRVLLTDPPWKYSNWGAPPGEVHSRARGAAKHYPTMTLEQLCALPVKQLGCSVVFMWTTWNHIMTVPILMHSWGFRYKTLAWVWVKTKQVWSIDPYNEDDLLTIVTTGMGYYTRHCTEPCLIGVAGSAPVAVRNIPGVIFSPRRAHSQKPQEQYSRIEQLYPGSTYYEMFARTHRPNWEVWGHDVDNTFELEVTHDDTG